MSSTKDHDWMIWNSLFGSYCESDNHFRERIKKIIEERKAEGG